MVELRLSPSDAIKLLSALGGTTTTAPAASDPKPAPASTAAQSSLEAIARVPGNTASSARGAKIGTQVTTSVSCPSGKTVVGGGAKVNTSDGMNTDRAQLSDSYASSDTTWTAVGVVSDANLGRDETLNVTAIALCG